MIKFIKYLFAYGDYLTMQDKLTIAEYNLKITKAKLSSNLNDFHHLRTDAHAILVAYEDAVYYLPKITRHVKINTAYRMLKQTVSET